ncbi:MAG TPA: hypothetical protein VIK08_07555 [Candidatus Limnocylindrales bacterium]
MDALAHGSVGLRHLGELLHYLARFRFLVTGALELLDTLARSGLLGVGEAG